MEGSDNELLIAGTDSSWSMHNDTSEPEGTDNLDKQPLEDNIFDIDLDGWSFQRGQDQELANPINGMASVPTIIHTNVKNEKTFRGLADLCLFLHVRIRYGCDIAHDLWKKVDKYISNMFDRCTDSSPAGEAFPILNRHQRHLSVTNHPLLRQNCIPNRIRRAILQQWEYLYYRYGSFNDLQNEQRALVDRGFSILCRYMEALTDRDMQEMLELNDLLLPLAEALNELWATQYVIRHVHFYEGPHPFLLATTEE